MSKNDFLIQKNVPSLSQGKSSYFIKWSMYHKWILMIFYNLKYKIEP